MIVIASNGHFLTQIPIEVVGAVGVVGVVCQLCGAIDDGGWGVHGGCQLCGTMGVGRWEGGEACTFFL